MEYKIWILYLYVMWTPRSLSFDNYYFETDNFAPDTSGVNEETVSCSGKGSSSEKHKSPLSDNSAQDIVKDLRSILRSVRTSAQQILNDVSDLQVELAADESQMMGDDKSTASKEKDCGKDKLKDKSKVDGEIVTNEFGFQNIKIKVSEKPSSAPASIVESNFISNEVMRGWDEQINACKNLLDSAKRSRSSSASDVPVEKKLDDKIKLMKTVRSLKNLIKVSRDPGPSGEVLQTMSPQQPDDLGVEKVETDFVSPWNEWLRA